jgi:hypothetical protein
MREGRFGHDLVAHRAREIAIPVQALHVAGGCAGSWAQRGIGKGGGYVGGCAGSWAQRGIGKGGGYVGDFAAEWSKFRLSETLISLNWAND